METNRLQEPRKLTSARGPRQGCSMSKADVGVYVAGLLCTSFPNVAWRLTANLWHRQSKPMITAMLNIYCVSQWLEHIFQIFLYVFRKLRCLCQRSSQSKSMDRVVCGFALRVPASLSSVLMCFDQIMGQHSTRRHVKQLNLFAPSSNTNRMPLSGKEAGLCLASDPHELKDQVRAQTPQHVGLLMPLHRQQELQLPVLIFADSLDQTRTSPSSPRNSLHVICPNRDFNNDMHMSTIWQVDHHRPPGHEMPLLVLQPPQLPVADCRIALNKRMILSYHRQSIKTSLRREWVSVLCQVFLKICPNLQDVLAEASEGR